jgi:predicted SnoaL-like aldol condensation-catalyzing enzyme
MAENNNPAIIQCIFLGEKTMSIQVQQNMEVIRNWFKVLNSGDIDEIRKYIRKMSSPNYMLHNPSLPDYKAGIDYLLAWFDQVIARHENIHAVIDDMFGVDDKVVYRLTLESTDVETRQKQNVQEIVISRFEDGKIVEEWEVGAPVS